VQSGSESTRPSNIHRPRCTVELAVDSIDLPPALRPSTVTCIENIDPLHLILLTPNLCHPTEGNDIARDGVNGQDLKANWWLRTLTSDEGCFGGERRRSKRDSTEPVNAVGCVGEIGGEQLVGDGGIEVSEEGCEAVDEGGGGVGSEANHVAGI